jgi:uncharacterized membrane protein
MGQASDCKRSPDGFRDRGVAVTRLEAFVDAAFAFAVTLLVISLDAIPDSIPAMVEALKGVPAFAVSFAQIAAFWSAHATWSRRFGLDDGKSKALSLLLVFLVLVYVYPLKILFGNFFAWISGHWLPAAAAITSLDDLRWMFVIYGVAFATMSFCLAMLYRHALTQAAVLALSAEEIAASRAELLRWHYTIAVAALSVMVALLLPARLPPWMLGLPGMLYGLLGFTGILMIRSQQRYLAGPAPPP